MEMYRVVHKYKNQRSLKPLKKSIDVQECVKFVKRLEEYINTRFLTIQVYGRNGCYSWYELPNWRNFYET